MPTFHHFQLGDLKCTALSDMSSDLSLLDLFTKVPQDELKSKLAELNMTADWVRQGSVLLIDNGSKKILIDTGLPNGQLVANLEAAGVTPADIDAIFITILISHFLPMRFKMLPQGRFTILGA